MRKLRKVLVLVLVLMTVMASFAVTASAATPEILYMTPNANWKQSNARFAAYFFGNGEKWVSMTDSDKDGVYEVAVPAGFSKVIFCRMNPANQTNSWGNKWNQTADLTIPTNGSDHYTVKEGTWDKGAGTWSTLNSTCEHIPGEAATCTTDQVCTKCGETIVSAPGHSYDAEHSCTVCGGKASFTIAGTGKHLGTEWDTGNTANDMEYDPTTTSYIKVYENVAAGSYMFKCARDHDWGTAYPSSDKAYTVAVAGSKVTITLTGTTVDVRVEEPHEHDYKTDVTDPTCTEGGFTTYTCTICGDSYTADEVAATGHKYETDVTAPTCTQAGFTTYTCACGDTYTADEVAATGHKHEAVVTAPTCTEGGYITFTCACGDTYTDGEVAARGHKYTDGICTECGEADPNYTEPTLPPVDGEPTPAPSFFEMIMNAIIMFFLQIMALLGL